MRLDVAGIGNALVDALVRLPDDALLAELGLSRGLMHPVEHDRWDRVHRRVKGLGVEVQTGGSCANTITILALMGARVRFRGQVGDDDFGRFYVDSMLQAAGGHGLRIARGGSTGRCLSLVSPGDAERTMLTHLGTAIELDGMGPFASTIRSSRLLHVTGYLLLSGRMVQAAWEGMEIARDAGVPVSLDVADPFVVAEVREAIRRALRDFASLAFLNQDEAAALTGLPPERAARELAREVETVVVKLGSRGSIVARGDRLHRIGISPVEAVDSTGAGDAYAAGFVYGWLRGWEPARCGRLGARVAALTVGRLGAVCRDRHLLAEALGAVGEGA